MDVANNSIESMAEGQKLLHSLEEDVSKIIMHASSCLKENYPSIDNNLQRELTEFISELNSFQKTLSFEFRENESAFDERIEKIQQYQLTAYHHRDIDI